MKQQLFRKMYSVRCLLHWFFYFGCLFLWSCLLLTPAQASLTDGLVAHWSFDDCTAKDVSGNGHDGVINGSPECTKGSRGKALYFDGANDYIQVEHSPLLNMSQSISFGAFINLRELAEQGGSDNIILNKEGIPFELAVHNTATASICLPDNIPKYNFSFYIDIDKKLSICWEDGGKSITRNNWTHLFVTYGTSEIKTYVNGALIKKYSISGSINNTNEPLRIAARGGFNTPNSFFNGVIDEVRIYNRALSEAEVKSLYTQQPVIKSVTPETVKLGEPTLFTVRGEGLVNGMGFALEDCDPSSSEQSGAGDPTQVRYFECTPQGKDGNKHGVVKTAAGGTSLFNFDIDVLPNGGVPRVTMVTPNKTASNKETIFTVYGENLTSGMGFAVAGCANSSVETGLGTAYRRQFKCTPYTSGVVAGVVKTRPGGLALNHFGVTVGKGTAAATLPIRYSDKVKKLSNTTLMTYRGVNPDGKLIFTGAPTEVTSLIAGDILVLGDAVALKVNGIVRGAKNTWVDVSGAAMSDVLVVDPTSQSAPFAAATSAPVYLNERNFIADGQQVAGVSAAVSPLPISSGSVIKQSISYTQDARQWKFTIKDHPLWDKDGDPNTTYDRIALDGFIELNAPAIQALTIKNDGLFVSYPTGVNIRFTASEKAQLTLSSKTLEFDKTFTLLLGQFIVPVPYSGGSSTVLVTLNAILSANGKVEFTTSVSQGVTVDVGMVGDLRIPSLVGTDKSKATLTVQEPTITGILNGELAARVNLDLQVLQYDLAGLGFQAGPTLALYGELDSTPCMKAKIGVKASSDGYIVLPHVDIGWTSIDLEARKHEQQFAEAVKSFYSKDTCKQ